MRMPRINDLIQKDLSYKIVGCLFKAQNNLGRYARESQYADILEKIFSESGLNYEREKKISKTGSDTNRADFVIENAVVVELKSKPFIEKNDYYQTKRYLEAANFERIGKKTGTYCHNHPKRSSGTPNGPGAEDESTRGGGANLGKTGNYRLSQTGRL